MEEERREDNVVDSSYDPQGEEGFSLEENSNDNIKNIV